MCICWWDEAFVGEGSRTLGLIMRQLPHAMDQQFFDQLPKMKQKGSTNHVYKFWTQIKTKNDVNWPKKIGTWIFL